MPINSINTYSELISKYHENPDQFVFFVGAGLSQPLFPSWGSLLNLFLDSAIENGLTHNPDELREYISKGENYLDVAEACIDAIGLTRYRDIMEKVFDRNFDLEDVPQNYSALIDLSPKTIITTNYDRLPEVSGKGLYRVGTRKNVGETLRSVSTGKHVVFKIHGDITDHSTIVLKSSDYQEIIYGNSEIRNLLNSLLSTKTLIFLGFSLSDPHIDSILQCIKVISGNVPISHYAVISEQSKFKISAFEKKYGLNVISYTPVDNSHSEIKDLLIALNHATGAIEERSEITKNNDITEVKDLINQVEILLHENFIDSPFTLFYESNTLHISLSTSGQTNSEIQKEILSIIKLMDFNCAFLNDLKVIIFANSGPDQVIADHQPSIVNLKLSFNDAKSYSQKKITTSLLWRKIAFFSPASLTDAYQSEESVTFQLSTGIVDV